MEINLELIAITHQLRHGSLLKADLLNSGFLEQIYV